MFLTLVPQKDEQQLDWMTLGDSLCDSESMPEMMTLSRLRDRLAQGLSNAVLSVPEKMQSYVAYAAAAVQDPHSDYAIQMRRVCRAHHAAFVRAVDRLGDGSPDGGFLATANSAWFRAHILNPEGCRVLALPEAD